MKIWTRKCTHKSQTDLNFWPRRIARGVSCALLSRFPLYLRLRRRRSKRKVKKKRIVKSQPWWRRSWTQFIRGSTQIVSKSRKRNLSCRNKKQKRVLRSAVSSPALQMKRKRNVITRTNSPITSQLMSVSTPGTLRQEILKDEPATILNTKRAKTPLLSTPTSAKKDHLKEQ